MSRRRCALIPGNFCSFELKINGVVHIGYIQIKSSRRIQKMRIQRCIYPMLILMLAFTMGVVAEAQVEAETPTTPPSFHQDSWHVSISPYLWLVGMNGTIHQVG